LEHNDHNGLGAERGVERIAGDLPRADARELLDVIVSLTPVEATIAAAVADFQQGEAALAARESTLRKREERAAAVDRALTDLESAL
jgi:hypothetical protein